MQNVLCDPCDPSPCPKNEKHECPCVPQPPPPPTPKYFLLDDRNIIDSTATLVLGKVEKHPSGPVIKEERDYEMRFDNMQPNVWYDPNLTKWRCWYSTFTSCSKPKTTVPYCNNASQKCGSVAPGENKADRGTAFLYAESSDGINWVKPNLGLVDWKGNKNNNIIGIIKSNIEKIIKITEFR